MLNKILANQIQQFINGSYTMIKWDLPQGCKDFLISAESITVVYHINKLKNKNHMIISVDAEKAFDKIQYIFMTKTAIELSRKWA